MAKKQSKGWWRITKKVLLWLFILHLVYILYGRWFNPPITLTQLGNTFGGYSIKRDYVAWDQISPYIKLAAIASEDQDFLTHNGFDWQAINKAIKGNSKTGLGATSTISQQTAKNFFLWQGKGFFKWLRKGPEFYFTKMTEWVWNKKIIMHRYLNIIEMGPGIYGVEAACKKYFNKSANNISRTEAALLIACLPNPKKYTVKPLSKFVQRKHQWILRQMKNLETNKEIAKFCELP
jgi:monofunctional glycosyltransferase